MPLPALNTQSTTNGFQAIKGKLNSKPSLQSVEKVQINQSNPPVTPLQRKVIPFNAPTKNGSPFMERVRAGQNELSNRHHESNSEANRKAIEQSRGQSNPLVPIMTEIAHTLVGIDKTLQNILSSLNSINGNLDSSMSDSGLNFEDWRKEK